MEKVVELFCIEQGHENYVQLSFSIYVNHSLDLD